MVIESGGRGPGRRRPVAKTASVVAAVTIMATAAFGACGGDDDSEATSTTGVDATTSTAAAAISTTAAAATTTTTAAAASTTAAVATSTTTTMPPPEVADVTFVTPGAGSVFGFLSVGQAEGVFAKYGLNVTTQVAQAQGQIPGLLSGEFDAIAQVGLAERASLQGQPVVSLLAVGTAATTGLVVSGDIQSVEDLKGETIATSAASSAPFLQIRRYLDDNGLASDVELLPVATQDARSTTFISGQTNAMFTTFDLAVQAAAQRDGAHILLDPSNFPAEGAQVGISVTSEFLTNNPNTVRALIAAIFESTKFVLENPQRTQEIYAEVLDMTPEQAKTVYEANVPFIVLEPTPSDAAFEVNAGEDSLGLERTVTVDEVKAVWDTTIAEEVFASLDCPDVCALS